MLSEKEQTLLELLKKNPYASQQDLAVHLGVSRPTVANLISGLIKSGKIKGRAYILSEQQSILVFGGMNLDRKMICKTDLISHTSNPVTSYQTVGGVARNIAENLGRLGNEVKLLSAAGHDLEWEFIYDKSSEWMDLQHVKRIDEERTGTYTAVLDGEGEMQLAFADMEIYQHLTPEWVQNHEKLFRSAKMIIIDLNLQKETIQTILEFARMYNTPLTIVPVSAPKMKNLPDALQGVTWFICNRGEAEMLSGMELTEKQDVVDAAVVLNNKGIEHVVITDGPREVYYGSTAESGWIQPLQPRNIQDVTGAGDSFVSATIHTWLEEGSIKKAVQAGLVNSSKTLESPFTVRPELTGQQLQIELEELQ